MGAISRLSMPLLISESQIGLLQLLDSISGVFVSVFNFGFGQVLARLFPRYRNPANGHHGFLAFGLSLSLMGVVFSSIIYYFFGNFLFENGQQNHLMRSFSMLVFPLLFFRMLYINMDAYARMLFASTIGVFLDGLLTKILFVVTLFLFWLSLIDYKGLVYCFTIALCTPGLIMLVYAVKKTAVLSLPHPELIHKNNRKTLLTNMLFGILMGASASIILYVDSLMINKMLTLAALGVYSVFFFAARLLLIPSQNINRISAAVVAESWERNDMKNIAEVYRKSSLNQLILGVYLFGVAWACLEPALSFLPQYAYGRYVFFYLGLGLLVEMLTGVNTVIISTSDKYQYNTYFNLALMAAVIVLNYFLISQFDLIGAAVASMLAMVFINVARWLFLYKVYGLQPFDLTFLKAFLVCLIFVLLCCVVDYEASPLVKMVINSVGLSLLFWSVVLRLKLSEDMNAWLLKMKNKFI